VDPLWYKDAVIYELHVRSFFDGNDDGYGDFIGLQSKLSYLQELGVNALWLLPFYESPLKDDGYDIADYTRILPVHGTTDDFRAFLDDAHGRGMQVIIELVLNHTSDRHPWFQEARRPGDPRRDWYVWSDTPEKFAEARVIFRDFEPSNWTWDPLAGAYFWHRFYAHQPDLNWHNPEVEQALHEAMFYWLDLGVDGLRLDAIPYLYEREGTSCENLPETIAAVKRLRRAVDERYRGTKLLLAEANQWPEDTIPYFGAGDGVHLAFNFPLMPRLYMALRREDRRPITEILQLTAGIPENAQWALFLRNHDELTLEMVTDEERDYLYREYAADPLYRLNLGIRRRLSPLLGGDRRRYELMTALLLTLPGTPVLYYGDEIGMGDNPFLGDRSGVRTPMQWTADRNAGFSRAPYQQLFLPPIGDGPYSYEFVNVEAARADPHSRLQFVRRLLGIRNRHTPLFGRGTLQILPVENRAILAFLRRHDGETVLVVANLSRYLQPFSVPPGDLAGCVPVELFSQAPFPAVGETPYPLVLGPHGFALFLVQPASAQHARPAELVETASLPRLQLADGLESMLVDTLVTGSAREELEELLPAHLARQAWLPLQPERVRLEDAIRLRAQPALYLCRWQVEPDAATVYLPVGLREEQGEGDLARVQLPRGEMLLHDASSEADLYALLLSLARAGWQNRSLEALFRARLLGPLPPSRELRVLRPGTAVDVGLWIRLALHQDGSMERTARYLPRLVAAGVPGVSAVLGLLEMRRGTADETLALLGSLPAHGRPVGAAEVVETQVRRTLQRLAPHPPSAGPGLLKEAAKEVLELARRLGARLAGLHLALASEEAGDSPVTARIDLLAGRLSTLEPSRFGLDPADVTRARRRLDALRQAELGGKPLVLHGAGLDGFLAVAGELYLTRFGPPGSCIALEDLAALGGDLERICYGSSPGSEAEDWNGALAGALRNSLLDAYRAAGEGTAFLPNRAWWNEFLFAFGVERALTEVARRGDDAATSALRRALQAPGPSQGRG
jgi:maltose alpha-D-glucosyltransferase / alpha-amylase